MLIKADVFFHQSPFSLGFFFLFLSCNFAGALMTKSAPWVDPRASLDGTLRHNTQLAAAWINEKTFTGAVRVILRHYVSLRASVQCYRGSLGQWEESWPQSLQWKFIHGIIQWKNTFPTWEPKMLFLDSVKQHKMLEMEPPGRRRRGRPKRRYVDAVKEDMQVVGVRVEDTENRVKWKTVIRCGDPWKGKSRK